VKTARSSLLDESVKKAAGGRLQFLYNDIRNVLENTETTAEYQRIEHPDTMENYDWEYARKRIKEIIKEYGKE